MIKRLFDRIFRRKEIPFSMVGILAQVGKYPKKENRVIIRIWLLNEHQN